MKQIFLIMIGLSIFLNAEFKSDNSIVLEWQDTVDVKNITRDWQNAIDYCENLTLDGKTDWKLPNINELTSLVDDTKYNPSLNESFKNFFSSFYWSSSTPSNFNNKAWVVYFGNGQQNHGFKDRHNYVRCVRVKS